MHKAPLPKIIRSLRNDERGATAIEYALICVFIAVAGLAGITGIGNTLKTTFNTVSTTLRG